MKVNEIVHHCREAAMFFDELASQIKVTPTKAKAIQQPDGAVVESIDWSNLLEGCLIRLYRDRAEALRAAADLLDVGAAAVGLENGQ